MWSRNRLLIIYLLAAEAKHLNGNFRFHFRHSVRALFWRLDFFFGYPLNSIVAAYFSRMQQKRLQNKLIIAVGARSDKELHLKAKRDASLSSGANNFCVICNLYVNYPSPMQVQQNQGVPFKYTLRNFFWLAVRPIFPSTV